MSVYRGDRLPRIEILDEAIGRHTRRGKQTKQATSTSSASAAG
jgi:hypothetical protein